MTHIHGISGMNTEHRDRSDDIRTAAQAVVDRWDTPLWKDAPHTAEFINRLRGALSAPPVELEEARLSPLPVPGILAGHDRQIPAFSADQMRAYARAALSVHSSPAMTDDELDEMALDELNLQDCGGEYWFVETGFLPKQDLRILLCRAIETERAKVVGDAWA